MRSAIVLISSLLSFIDIQAQSIYNFNNKYTVGYSANILKLSNLSLKDKNNVGLGLLQHQFILQRKLTKNVSLVINYMYSKKKTEMDFNRSPRMVVKGTDSFTTNPQERYLEHSGTITFRANVISLGVRTYLASKGAIAPFGRFYEFKAGYARLNYKANEDQVVFSYPEGYQLKNDGLNEGLSNYGIDHLDIVSLQAGYGDSKPIIRNLTLEWMVNFNLNLPLWSGNVRDNEVSFRDLYLYRNARIWYGINNRVRFNIGLHYGF